MPLLKLRPWQKWLLIHIGEILPDGSNRFSTVLVLVSRQNGKSVIFNVLGLWTLFIDRGEFIMSIAQDLKTARLMWKNALKLVKANPSLKALLDRVSNIAGAEAFTLKDGREWGVASSAPGAARGTSNKLVGFDELGSQYTTETWTAIKPSLIAVWNSMLIAMSNAGTYRSVVLNKLREQAIAAKDDPDTGLAIFEWSAPDDVEGDELDNIDHWAQANPSMGYGALTVKTIRDARRTMSEGEFKTEHLCVYTPLATGGVFGAGDWEACSDPSNGPRYRGSFISASSERIISVDTSADRSMTSIGIAGWRDDELAHVEIITKREGQAWVIPYLVEKLASDNAAWTNVTKIVVQGKATTASHLIELMEKAGLPVFSLQGSDVGAAAGAFYDGIRDGLIRHIDQEDLNVAAATAATRKWQDLWAFDRDGSPEDIAGLIAVEQAYFALTISALRFGADAPSIYETEAPLWG
nr:hypothetical protein BJQ95_02392 [Cryobacterium sp. SO1]